MRVERNPGTTYTTMMSNAIIESGTPEQLIERLKKRAPSLTEGRYRLVVQPEPDIKAVAAKMRTTLAKLDQLPGGGKVSELDDEALLDMANAEIAVIRKSDLWCNILRNVFDL